MQKNAEQRGNRGTELTQFCSRPVFILGRAAAIFEPLQKLPGRSPAIDFELHVEVCLYTVPEPVRDLDFFVSGDPTLQTRQSAVKGDSQRVADPGQIVGKARVIDHYIHGKILIDHIDVGVTICLGNAAIEELLDPSSPTTIALAPEVKRQQLLNRGIRLRGVRL